MNEFQPILLVLTLGAIAAAVAFWRSAGATAEKLKAAEAERQKVSAELAEAKRETDKKAKDLESARKQLQESKHKVERLKKERHSAKKTAPAPTEEAPRPDPVPTARVTEKALEEEYGKKLDALQNTLDKARQRVSELESKERKRAEETKRVAAKLSEGLELPPVEGDDPEARLQAMTTQLQAIQQAAMSKEKELTRALRKAESEAKGAGKRAASHHALYQVIKGQLEMTEDRLAEYRRKYEGAKRPNELRRIVEPTALEPQPAVAPPPEPPASGASEPTSEPETADASTKSE